MIGWIDGLMEDGGWRMEEERRMMRSYERFGTLLAKPRVSHVTWQGSTVSGIHTSTVSYTYSTGRNSEDETYDSGGNPASNIRSPLNPD